MPLLPNFFTWPNPSKCCSDHQEAILSHSIVAKVVSKTALPAENVLQILRNDRRSENIVKMVASLTSRAFLCLNNLVQALSVDDLGGPGIGEVSF